MATITGWMAGYFKDQSIKGKTGVLALKRSNEGWAGQLRACIIFGRAQLKHSGRAEAICFFCTRIKNILGAKAAQMGLPGAGQGRDLHQEGV